MKGSRGGFHQQSKGTVVNEKMKQAAAVAESKGSLACIQGRGTTDNFRLVEIKAVCKPCKYPCRTQEKKIMMKCKQ